MRVAVIGAGGIGAVIAAAAVESGHNVSVCVRTPIDSLVLERPDKAVVVAATLVSDPAQLVPGSFDVVWLTTKAGDTAAAAPWLHALLGAETLLASAQNGLDHHARVAPYLPPGSQVEVAPALAYMAAEKLAAGRVRHLAGDRLVVPASAADMLSESVANAGLTVRGSADIHSASWRKLLSNVVANPITALTMRRIAVMQEPGMADLARGILEEALTVGRADGADLDDSLIDSIITGTAQYGSETGSSMLYDRLAGRPLEHQYLTGEVVRRGHRYQIPVPINSAVLALLEAIDRAPRP